MATKENVIKQSISSYGAIPHQELTSNGPISRKHFQWYINMILINFVEFSAESSRGIVLATLFLYGKSLGGDLAFMGLLTSVFSVGRFLSSIIFGWMCDRYSFRTVYIVSSSICLIGNFMYLIADEHVTHSKFLLAVSRFVVGFGAGNRSVCRANVAAMTLVSQRLKYMTILAAVVFLGYALTPGLGSLVTDANFFVFSLHINKYTAPGTILMLINFLSIISMIFLYDEEIGRNDAPLDPSNLSDIDPNTLRTALSDELVKIGVFIFIFLNFNARGILSIFETINIPLFLKATGHDPSSHIAVVEASNFQFYLGCIGLLSYLCIAIFRNKISDVNWLSFGFLSLSLGNLILCFSPSQFNLTRLLISELFIWSIGCPITTAVAVAAFSKILGGRPQGTLMGLLGSAASISRIILPLLPSLFSNYTPLFIINLFLCITSIYFLKWYDHKVHQARKEETFFFESSPSPHNIINSIPNPTSPLHMQP